MVYTLNIVKVKSLSRVRLFVTPCTIAYQVPLPMGFSRQEYGVGCHVFLQEIFPTQRLILGLLHCRHNALPSEPPGKSKRDINKMKQEQEDVKQELRRNTGYEE